MSEYFQKEFTVNLDEGYSWETTKEKDPGIREKIQRILWASKQPIAENNNSNIAAYCVLSVEGIEASIKHGKLLFDTNPSKIDSWMIYPTKTAAKTLRLQTNYGFFSGAAQYAEKTNLANARIHALRETFPPEIQTTTEFYDTIISIGNHPETLNQEFNRFKEHLKQIPGNTQDKLNEIRERARIVLKEAKGLLIGLDQKALNGKISQGEKNAKSTFIIYPPENPLTFNSILALKPLGKRDASYIKSLQRRI